MENFPFLSVRDLSKTVQVGREDLHILSNIDFKLSQGATLAIVGASGSGKSTLLSLIAGLDKPTSGHIDLENRMLSDLSEDERAALRLEKIGFIFQSFLLLPKLTALENVMLPSELQGLSDVDTRAKMLLTQVGLQERLHYFPSQLSGGEQQRVAIARAFVTMPTLLLADEPTGNLDHATGNHVADLLFDLNAKEGTTLIIVTHDQNLAARCQNSVTLSAGRMCTQ